MCGNGTRQGDALSLPTGQGAAMFGDLAIGTLFDAAQHVVCRGHLDGDACRLGVGRRHLDVADQRAGEDLGVPRVDQDHLVDCGRIEIGHPCPVEQHLAFVGIEAATHAVDQGGRVGRVRARRPR